MNKELHHKENSVIGIIRRHIEAWRKENQWSRETVAGEVMKSHAAINGTVNSGIELESKADTFETLKINAQRIYRWLDDVTKDINLMPLNFLPTILATMPHRIRIRCVNEILLPLDLTCRPILRVAKNKVDVTHLQELIRESSEAQQAVVELMDGATREELIKAHNELQQAIDVSTKILHMVESSISEMDRAA